MCVSSGKSGSKLPSLRHAAVDGLTSIALQQATPGYDGLRTLSGLTLRGGNSSGGNSSGGTSGDMLDDHHGYLVRSVLII